MNPPSDHPVPLSKMTCDPQVKAFLHNVELLGRDRIFHPWELLDFQVESVCAQPAASLVDTWEGRGFSL